MACGGQSKTGPNESIDTWNMETLKSSKDDAVLVKPQGRQCGVLSGLVFYHPAIRNVKESFSLAAESHLCQGEATFLVQFAYVRCHLRQHAVVHVHQVALDPSGRDPSDLVAISPQDFRGLASKLPSC